MFLFCWFLVSVLFLALWGRRPAASRAAAAPVVSGPACSLAVRAAVVPSSCCLLLSRSGRPLSGGALAARVGRLRRSGVLV
ncbi:hypothetical protein [Picosynechococcus sp. NKBG15041c]|uniref:hypothetical protein n=1 Tax=Picosynechococcus sp. NKBG15041c TaxID=1407650 RepID=UPI0011DDB414|nr:hypothetical protein [Picosynechococcus sp. NKBG15041c]